MIYVILKIIIKFKKESYVNKIKIKVVKNKISDINVILMMLKDHLMQLLLR